MTIDIELSEQSLDAAIQMIEDYSKTVRENTKTLVDKTAESVEQYAAYELAKHIDTGETLASLKTTHRKPTQNTETAVVSVGGAAVWLEFGTGVVTNDSYVGGYVHPKGAELGMCGLGTYGEGHGAEPDYYGIPATLFMWNSAQTAKRDLPGLAKEVFRT